MNNRYLYRAKRKNCRGLTTEMWWVEGYLYGIWERRYILWGMTNDVTNMVEVDPSTICQCTGLKDKNGKLIWENDIVKINGVVYICFWNESNFEWGFKNNAEDFGVAYVSSDEINVIGSVIDNPELLEVGE